MPVRWCSRSPAVSCDQERDPGVSSVMAPGPGPVMCGPGADATTAAVVIEAGAWYGFGAYVATSALAILLTPSSAVMYVLFFGWYPSVKYLVERIDKRIPEWIIKLLLFNAAFAALYFIFPAVITDITPNFAEIFYVMAAILNAAFIVFDIGLSKIINYYARHIFPKIRRK